jgi:hypothetical protein
LFFSKGSLFSNPVARFPNEKTECSDQANHDEHPVLAFKAEKAEFLNKKLHGTRPFVGQGTRFGVRNILILYRCSVFGRTGYRFAQ